MQNIWYLFSYLAHTTRMTPACAAYLRPCHLFVFSLLQLLVCLFVTCLSVCYLCVCCRMIPACAASLGLSHPPWCTTAWWPSASPSPASPSGSSTSSTPSRSALKSAFSATSRRSRTTNLTEVWMIVCNVMKTSLGQTSNTSPAGQGTFWMKYPLQILYNYKSILIKWYIKHSIANNVFWYDDSMTS